MKLDENSRLRICRFFIRQPIRSWSFGCRSITAHGTKQCPRRQRRQIMLKSLRERRQAARYTLDRFAKIQIAGSLPRDCMIVDISDTGIRLHAEHTEVPDEFLILISGVRQARRECRVVWRLGYEVGAEFTDMEHGLAESAVASLG
ncbi:PilZ domain-containing protein [Xanthobacteraceae bacterium Astr-EGSB]|uniref:PilZ domain-containing protein n=1 Tax=Astrobacterium formosum TaxID=3069710 RepID=UPI0027B1881E|nr:PilZ domain-containing protein [Xanthobacteraceae bacterium Astr-EGSB]